MARSYAALMPRLFLFADEAGCFGFKRGPNISKYYIVCTIICGNPDIGVDLLNLRRRLAWAKAPLGDYFHATADRQVIRDEVFRVISNQDFEIQATIMEKSKAQPHVRASDDIFYKYGWHYHFKHSSRNYLRDDTELMTTVASLGTKRKRIDFEDAVRDVVSQIIARRHWVSAFWPCQSDPCLQIADYCTWAIQRKWELGDTRSYDLISNKITYEFELWRHGDKHYY
jgi:hypothetical protein